MFLAVLTLGISSCQSAEKNSTGSEYMPDMGHSIAYEANVYGYYSFNRWGSRDEYHAMAQPRVPVDGTIPRTRNGSPLVNEINVPSAVGSVPYKYEDSEEGRARAMAEIIANPYPITDAGLARGKELYNVFCSTCHGEKGDGAGYLVRDDGGKYPVQPANFLLEEHVTATNGRYYHSIMHGRNLMGSYKDKINYQERWEVIHYIRSLQAADKKLEYSEKSNTLNSIEVPGAVAAKREASSTQETE